MKGAYALQEIFKKEGVVNCTIEWLLHGIGETPISMHFYPEDLSKEILTKFDDEKINKEINLFYIHHPNAIHTIIEDDLMQPYFKQGDYVAGVRCDFINLENTLCQSYILQTYQGIFLVRNIITLDENGKFILKNNKSDKVESINSNKILSVAPIIWFRRKINRVF